MTLFDVFNQMQPLNEKDRSLLDKYWSEKQQLKRGEYLLRSGQIDRYLYFVEQGSLRVYFPTENGEEYAVAFGYTGNIFNSVPSFLLEKPSEFAIQALKKSRILKISKQQLLALRAESPNIEKCWQYSMEMGLIGLIERESTILIPDPRVRLKKLLKRTPALFQYVPLKHIASYLRMTPETLSRIFKEI